jgi:acyl-coenzyme A synthetase/AMP-(fatty) acid ligase
MLTSDALRIRADSQPHREIFRCGEETLTYGEWDRRSSALARSFMLQGIQQQECVILSFPGDQWISYVVALLAVQKVGAIAVSLPSALPVSIAEKVLTRTAARHSAGDIELPGVNRLDCIETAEGRALEFQVAAGPEAIAEILMTSGTTGTPKLVACPHGNLTWRTVPPEVFERYQDQTAQSLSHPMIGSNAAQRTIVDALRGSLAVYNILPSFDPVTVFQLVESRQIEHVAFVPAKAAALLRAGRGMSFHTVRWFHLSSAHTPAWIANGLAQLFPEATILNKYGLTEGGRFRIEGAYDFSSPGRIGRPADGHSVCVKDEQGNELPAGTTGELWVRDPTPYQRFYYREDDTAGDYCSADGWVCTNDLAFIDEDGRVTLVGRTSDIANVGGLKVSLREVEEAVATIDGVLDCAAFSLPHRTTGEMICIGVVNSPADEMRLERAKAGLARQLGSRFPRLWITLPEIPRTFTGKIERGALAQRALTQFPELNTNRKR